MRNNAQRRSQQFRLEGCEVGTGRSDIAHTYNEVCWYLPKENILN